MNNELEKKYGLPTATACCVFFCAAAVVSHGKDVRSYLIVFAAAAGRSSRLPAITSASSRHRNFLLFFMVLCTFLSGAPQRASIF